MLHPPYHTSSSKASVASLFIQSFHRLHDRSCPHQARSTSPASTTVAHTTDQSTPTRLSQPHRTTKCSLPYSTAAPPPLSSPAPLQDVEDEEDKEEKPQAMAASPPPPPNIITMHASLSVHPLEGDLAIDRFNSIPLPDILKASIHTGIVCFRHANPSGGIAILIISTLVLTMPTDASPPPIRLPTAVMPDVAGSKHMPPASPCLHPAHFIFTVSTLTAHHHQSDIEDHHQRCLPSIPSLDPPPLRIHPCHHTDLHRHQPPPP